MTGIDSNGNPCDFLDEDGTIWIYLGKRYGINVTVRKKPT